MSPEKDTIYHYLYKQIAYCKIPDFQRPYSWADTQIKSFCQDVEETVVGTKKHYFGTIVYVPDDGFSTIIDGQQRLTTCVLMLIAAYHILQDSPDKSAKYSADQIREQFLYDNYGRGGKGVRKIILRTVTTDDNILNKIFERTEPSKDERANKLFKAYMSLKTWLEHKELVDPYVDALDRFEIVRISIKEDDDNPQKVFENINATGEPLSSGDKIRNWALMLNSDEARNHVYSNYWQAIEHSLTRVEKNRQVSYISDFFRNYLMCKKDEYVSDEDTYPTFKEVLGEAINPDQSIPQIDAFYSEVIRYLNAYLLVRFGEGAASPSIQETLFNIRFLRNSLCTPFAMRLLTAQRGGDLTESEVERSFAHLESYLGRRAITKRGLAGLNKAFPRLYENIESLQSRFPDRSFDDAYAAYLLDRSGKTDNLPNDAEVRGAIETLDLYHTQAQIQKYILGKISDSSKESSLLHQMDRGELNLSIEHVMPQTLSNIWKAELGDDWEAIHQKWLHVLANLTLTGYNSEYSNRSFAEKKQMPNGFDSSPLVINQYFSDIQKWDGAALENRSSWLIKMIQKVWPTPETTIDIAELSRDSQEEVWYSPFQEQSPTGKKPHMLKLGNEVHEVSTWKAMLQDIARYLDNEHHDIFRSYVDNNGLGIANGEKYLTHPTRVKDDLYVEGNASARWITRFIVAALEGCEIPNDSDEILFTIR